MCRTDPDKEEIIRDTDGQLVRVRVHYDDDFKGEVPVMGAFNAE
jgi:hypothetical protein